MFTKADGVVPWRSCVDVPGPRSENIEVFGSHCGLGFNPAVLGIVADRLRLGKDEWRPFKPAPWHVGPYRARVHVEAA